MIDSSLHDSWRNSSARGSMVLFVANTAFGGRQKNPPS